MKKSESSGAAMACAGNYGTLSHKVSVTFDVRNLMERCLALPVLRALCRSGEGGAGYIGDERQDEFMEAQLRLAAWRVCAELSGYCATVDFDTEERLGLHVWTSLAAEDPRCDALESSLGEWICADAVRAALDAMGVPEDEGGETGRRGSAARQRVMMLLCASDVLRQVI